MDRFTQERLNLNPRTDEELREVLTGLERKWQDKARHHLIDRNSHVVQL